MEIDEALTIHLLAQSGLTAIIGNRIYPDDAPQGTNPPYVVYLNISDVKDHTLTGQQKLESPVYQYSIYANTTAQAKLISAQIKAAISDYQGTMSGIEVQYIKLLNELHSTQTIGDQKVNYLDLEYEVNFIKE